MSEVSCSATQLHACFGLNMDLSGWNESRILNTLGLTGNRLINLPQMGTDKLPRTRILDKLEE